MQFDPQLVLKAHQETLTLRHQKNREGHICTIHLRILRHTQLAPQEPDNGCNRCTRNENIKTYPAFGGHSHPIQHEVKRRTTGGLPKSRDEIRSGRVQQSPDRRPYRHRRLLPWLQRDPVPLEAPIPRLRLRPSFEHIPAIFFNARRCPRLMKPRRYEWYCRINRKY